MARKKIGWRMKLRRELRQARQEEKIRARDLKKRQKAQERILGDVDVDAVSENSKKVALASRQLEKDGYEPSEDAVETMVQYNDVYGDGNGDLDADSFAAFDNQTNSLENVEGGEAYGELLHNIGDIVSNFEENFSKYNSDSLEDCEENFGEKFMKFIAGGKKVLGGNKNGSEKDSSNLSLEEIANDIDLLYPQKANRLRTLAKGQNTTGSKITMLILGAVVGVIVAKVFEKMF